MQYKFSFLVRKTSKKREYCYIRHLPKIGIFGSRKVTRLLTNTLIYKTLRNKVTG